MRFSAIFSLVALTSVVPALAAPVVSGPQYAKRQTTHSAFARDDDDESGALSGINWSSISKWLKLPSNISGGPYGGHHKRDDAEDLFTRELVARADGDESGAFPWLPLIAAAPTIVDGASRLFKWIKGKREFEEFFARELSARADDESGAFWGTVLRWAPTIINAASKFFNKRDVEELLARGDDAQIAREFEEHLSRELIARGADDESGAFWGTLLKWAPTIINTASKFFNKRDIEELLARGDDAQVAREFEEHLTRELLARGADDESGAFWGGVFRTIVRAAPTIIRIANGIINKREFEDILARSIFEARSLNELD